MVLSYDDENFIKNKILFYFLVYVFDFLKMIFLIFVFSCFSTKEDINFFYKFYEKIMQIDGAMFIIVLIFISFCCFIYIVLKIFFMSFISFFRTLKHLNKLKRHDYNVFYVNLEEKKSFRRNKVNYYFVAFNHNNKKYKLPLSEDYFSFLNKGDKFPVVSFGQKESDFFVLEKKLKNS